jgi:hypothetical protein
MAGFRIEPIDPSLAAAVRETLRDPIYGLPVRAEPATGYGPCRLCLKTFEAGEARILFLYNPFSTEQDAEFAGPVFVHADACAPYADVETFPESIAHLPIELRGYDAQLRRVAHEAPAPDERSAALRRMFEQPAVAFVHARNVEARCFVLRARRADQP